MLASIINATNCLLLYSDPMSVSYIIYRSVCCQSSFGARPPKGYWQSTNQKGVFVLWQQQPDYLAAAKVLWVQDHQKAIDKVPIRSFDTRWELSDAMMTGDMKLGDSFPNYERFPKYWRISWVLFWTILLPRNIQPYLDQAPSLDLPHHTIQLWHWGPCSVADYSL